MSDIIYFNELCRDFKMEVCKVNREVIGVVPSECLKSITRNILEVDNIEISIDKYIFKNGKKIINPLWEIMREERLICLNSKEYFVLKNNGFIGEDNVKNFIGYSLEYKLSKIDIAFEDIFIKLIGEDLDNDIYSLNRLLYEDSGWEFGYIEDSVLYDINDGIKVEKVRWCDSVNKRWFDYIKNDICDMFGCIPYYDTLNKKINLYSIENYGENVQLYLSKDNYIKNIERVGSSEEIVTRLYLVGQDEMNIIGSTVTGYSYIEDYSYFMENNEMSESLLNKLTKYYEMVEKRQVIWEELVQNRLDKTEILYRKKRELYVIYAEIKSKETVRESYDSLGDDKNSAIIAADITKLRDEKLILEIAVKEIEDELVKINESIENINTLCKRESATDEDGILIFDNESLEELKEFVYCETYSNSSFVDVEDLIEAGERELSLSCYPDVSYNFELEPFLNRVRENGFNINWKGNLGLGDIIILYDDDLEKEVYLYVNSYTQYPSAVEDENELEIEVSNKKIADSNVRVIADRLKESELNMDLLKRKVHFLNEQKYNRINLDKEELVGIYEFI